MNEQALAELIKQTVEATSSNGTPNYTILASVILLAFGLFALLTKYMGGQIIKNQQQSALDSKTLLKSINDNVGQQGLDIARHDERISTTEKQIGSHRENIIKLFETKADKTA